MCKTKTSSGIYIYNREREIKLRERKIECMYIIYMREKLGEKD